MSGNQTAILTKANITQQSPKAFQRLNLSPKGTTEKEMPKRRGQTKEATNLRLKSRGRVKKQILFSRIMHFAIRSFMS
eukprot:6455725-Amphidinium_carterae.2